MSAHLYQSTQIAISQAAGTGTPVAAVSGCTVRVVSGVFVATAASTLKLESATTTSVATGAMSLAANGILVLPYNPDGWFTCVQGEGLSIVVGSTGPVVGSLNYVQV